MSSEIRELQSKLLIILQALSSSRLYFQIGRCLVRAACFGALYLRDPLWSEFASGEHTEQSSRLLGTEMRARSMRVAPPDGEI